MRAGGAAAAMAMTAVVSCVSSASAARVPLVSLSRAQTQDLLHHVWGVPPLAAALGAEFVDGLTLAHADESDFDPKAYDAAATGVRPHHWKRFWRFLRAARDEGGGTVDLPDLGQLRAQAHPHQKQEIAVEAAGEGGGDEETEFRRRLGVSSAGVDLAGYSGVKISSNASLISMGSVPDVKVYRDGAGSLHVDAVGGMDVDQVRWWWWRRW